MIIIVTGGRTEIVRDSKTLCPIARATALFGDKWSILLVRELSFGVSRFDELQAQTGATPQMLATRLKQLAADGILTGRVYSRRPLRREYHLTEKGWGLVPVLFALRAWGERWCKRSGQPLAIVTTHRQCKGEVGLDGVCRSCSKIVPLSEVIARPSPEYTEERRRAGLH